MTTYLNSVGSTNDWMKERIDELSHGDGVIAMSQTAGKGRLGRTWESKAGDGMYLSVMLLAERMEDMMMIPLLCGLAVCDSAKELCGAEFGLKWPNDIICSEKKVGGILCEGRNGRAVCGIGVNINQDAEYFASKELPNGASLKMLGIDAPDGRILAKSITEKLLTLYDMLQTDGREAIMKIYKPRCVTIGREVTAHFRDREVCGVAVDVDVDGNLIIETEDGKISVNSGEVKLRLRNGNYV